uniref:C2 domain-containing protein n=1 Tax=Arcella intermedia TaxID=1963864 RepID=A0A6B2L2D3_9EUKA
MGECEFSIKELTFSWLVKPILKHGKSMGALLFSDAHPLSKFEERKLPVSIRMHCSAARLARMDGPLSKSDPYFVVKGSIKINAKTRQDVILYRSEVVYNNLDPTWKPFVLSVAELGGFDKPFSIIVYDFDADGSHDVMGQFTTTLNEYLFGPFQHAIMKGSNSSGAFSVDKVEPLGSIDVERIATSYRVGVSASKISPMDLNGKADPFFEVYAKPCVGYDWYDTEVNGFVSLNQLPPNLPLPPLVPDPTIYRPPQVPFIPNIVPIPNPQMMTNPYPQRPVLTIEEALQPPQQHSRYVLVPKFTNTEILLYRSEIKRKQLNPIWKDFELNLSIIGGIDVPFRILGRDWDADGTHDTIGEAFVTFREFLYGSFQRALKDGSSTKGGFNVDWIKKVEGTEKILPVAIKVECSAHKLANLDTGIGQKSDPLFEIIGKPYGAQSEITLYRSEVIMNNLSPKWQPFTLNVFDVGGYDSVFHVRVKDWDSDGSHDLIGELHTTIRNWSFGSF